MRIKLLGLQIGPFEKNDTYDSYMGKQYDLLEKGVQAEKPYLAMFPEMQTGPFFCTVREDKWFENAEPIDGVTVTAMLAKSKDLGVHIAFSFFEKTVERSGTHYYNSMGLASPTRGLIGLYGNTHIPWLETK